MQDNIASIKIANRTYPITVELGQEDGLKAASTLINQMLDELKNKYAVRDLQDLLAMCCLELAHYKTLHNGQPQSAAPVVTPSANSNLIPQLATEMEALSNLIETQL